MSFLSYPFLLFFSRCKNPGTAAPTRGLPRRNKDNVRSNPPVSPSHTHSDVGAVPLFKMARAVPSFEKKVSGRLRQQDIPRLRQSLSVCHCISGTDFDQKVVRLIGDYSASIAKPFSRYARSLYVRARRLIPIVRAVSVRL